MFSNWKCEQVRFSKPTKQYSIFVADVWVFEKRFFLFTYLFTQPFCKSSGFYDIFSRFFSSFCIKTVWKTHPGSYIMQILNIKWLKKTKLSKFDLFCWNICRKLAISSKVGLIRLFYSSHWNRKIAYAIKLIIWFMMYKREENYSIEFCVRICRSFWI